ncbi:PIN domain-containing protein [Mucilaginibacter ginsenosidivorans]|uniref:PIN domain-containing protein n=1 Tax=Mucilaginibacter ginsenosidivorans TaxID=398053 RepID=UPI001652059F|nr:PIN domain-containing protein [Mucilaginibacter ginsenosidivorans]
MDSNILLVVIGRKSRFKPIWDAFIEGRYRLIISDEITYEYEEVLQQHSAPGVSAIVMEVFIESPDVIFQHVYYNWNAIKADPDDDKFFDAAVAANADYLVTNDTHFNIINESDFPSVKVISANTFLELLCETNEL